MRFTILTMLFLSIAPGAFAAPASVKSDFCRKLYDGMAAKPAKKAFALSTDGKVCNAYWGEASQAVANRKAVAGCQENNERKCRLFGFK